MNTDFELIAQAIYGQGFIDCTPGQSELVQDVYNNREKYNYDGQLLPLPTYLAAWTTNVAMTNMAVLRANTEFIDFLGTTQIESLTVAARQGAWKDFNEPATIPIVRKPTKRDYQRYLSSLKDFTGGPMSIIVEVGNPDYYKLRAIEATRMGDIDLAIKLLVLAKLHGPCSESPKGA